MSPRVLRHASIPIGSCWDERLDYLKKPKKHQKWLKLGCRDPQRELGSGGMFTMLLKSMSRHTGFCAYVPYLMCF